MALGITLVLSYFKELFLLKGILLRGLSITFMLNRSMEMLLQRLDVIIIRFGFIEGFLVLRLLGLKGLKIST
jgi:hypothetical protein